MSSNRTDTTPKTLESDNPEVAEPASVLEGVPADFLLERARPDDTRTADNRAATVPIIASGTSMTSSCHQLDYMRRVTVVALFIGGMSILALDNTQWQGWLLFGPGVVLLIILRELRRRTDSRS